MSKMDELIKELNKKSKEEIITMGLNDFAYKRIPFTSPRMNYCTYGGLPVGKLIEFCGEEHGGKTTTALDIVANYQKSGDNRQVLYCDCENTLDADWARKLGVDVDNMYILQPKAQSAEEIFQFIYESVETGEIGLFVIDSLGVMVSSQEMEKTLEEKTYGGISRALTSFCKRIEMSMQRHKCTGIGINQMRDLINSTWGGQTTPGGKAWKHCCSVRMQFSRGKFTDETGKELTRSVDEPAGNIVMMSMIKNKTCKPDRRTGFYTLNYNSGIDYLKDLIDIAIRFGIIRQAGAWFDIIDTDTGEVLKDKIHGQSAVKTLLIENKDILDKVQKLVEDMIK